MDSFLKTLLSLILSIPSLLPSQGFAVKEKSIPEPSSKPLNLLVFGDSLASGYVAIPFLNGIRVRHLKEFAPFSDTIKDLNPSFTVENAGKPGEKAERMASRLTDILENSRSRNIRYDYFILIAGTNDIGIGNAGDRVYEDLYTLITMALEDKITKVIVLTIPQNQIDAQLLKSEDIHTLWEDSDPKKKLSAKIQVNRLLKDLSKEHERLYVYDLYKKFPFSEEKYSDSLHFSKESYKKIGKGVSKLIQKIEYASRE